MSTNHLAPRIRLSHRASLIGYFLILGLLIATTFRFPPPADTSLALVLGIKLLPLLILLPGLLKDLLRAHVWLCFVLLLYFTQAVLYVTQTQGYWAYDVLCVLIILVFLSSMMHVHWSKKAGVRLNPVR